MNNDFTWEKEYDEKGNVVKVTLVRQKEKDLKPLKEAEPVKEAK